MDFGPPQARKNWGYFVMGRLNFYVGISLYVGINFMSELRYVGIRDSLYVGINFMSELTLWWNYFMADSNFRDLQKSATLWWYFLYVGISYHFMGELLYAEMDFQRIAKTHNFMVGLTLW